MRFHVLVIGGGCTGAGIARDMALRGANVMLLEKGDFCNGASGGNHGMLHSGARYAVKDPGSARECTDEGKILRRIAPQCIESTGGIFVGLDKDDPMFPDLFQRSCRSAGVPAEAMTRHEVLAQEPAVSPDVVQGFAVQDGSIDPFRLVLDNVRSARTAGATVRNHCTVVGMEVKNGQIAAVTYQDQRNGSLHQVEAEIVVNASGAWADQVATMAGCRAAVQMDFGSLVVFNGRSVDHLINRLRMPADGDIIVPNHTSMIAGTTSRTVRTMEEAVPTEDEVQRLLRQATEMVPGIASCRAVRAYGGVRPLISSDGRDSSRGFRLIDHAEEGVDNLVSIIGGKLTTYRLMAEKASDHISRKLGISSKCVAGKEPLLSEPMADMPSQLTAHQLASLQRRHGPSWQAMMPGELSDAGAEEVCGCEGVSRFELTYFASSEDVLDLADLLRRTRSGMGYCQGVSCTYQMLAAMCEAGNADPARLMGGFLAERSKGRAPVLRGDQLRQEVMRKHLLANMVLEKEDGK